MSTCGTCGCGLDLAIWQNSWNHAEGCDMQPGTVTAPDRPGDRDQQQAAEVLGWQLGETPARMSTEAQQRLDGVARTLARIRSAARAEEAARWQAKIEALADSLVGGHRTNWEIRQSLRALLVSDDGRDVAQDAP